MSASNPTSSLVEAGGREHLFRREDYEVLSGKRKYTGDVEPDGVLYAAIYRSPYAHARILRVDITAACRLPGVVGGLTGATLPEWVGPMSQQRMSQRMVAKAPTVKPNPIIRSFDHYCLATDKVRFVGEPVAVILATDRYVAQDALELIEAEFDPLPVVLDEEEACRDGSPLLYEEWGSNRRVEFQVRNGDVDEAFRTADYVIEERIKSHRFTGTPMECRAVVATYDPAHCFVEMWDTTQFPHHVASMVEDGLHIPSLKVRVHSEAVGGGFGQKVPMYPEEQLIPVLAVHFGRPVKWVELRREHMVATCHAREQTHHLKVAVNRDGRILGLEDTIFANGGAAYPTPGYSSHITTTMFVTGTYKIQNYRCQLYSMSTNKTPFGAHRGLGKSEAAYVIERLMDIVAERLGMDPGELRQRNFIQPEDFPYLSASGNRYDSGNYPTALRRALELAEYDKWRQRQAELRASGSGSRHIGIGIAVCVEPSSSVRRGGPTPGYLTVRLQINLTGQVYAFISGNDEGQGHEASVQQIISQELHVPFDDVYVVEGDTLACPIGPGSHAAHFSVVGTSACYKAAWLMAARLKRIVAYVLGEQESDLELAAGMIRSRASGQAMSIREIADVAYSRPQDLPEGMDPCLELLTTYRDPNASGLSDEWGRSEMFGSYPYGADVAVIEIDAETGLMVIHKYVTVHDCGKLLNQKIVEGQHLGSLAHGIGGALYESLPYDESGQPLHQTFIDYLVPTAMEIPEVTMEHMETPNPFTPGGHKGGSETGTVTAPPAFANAVEDALRPLGVKVRETPVTPEYIWRQIQLAKATR